MGTRKLADELIALDRETRKAQLRTLSDWQRKKLRPYWPVWAHPGQVAPAEAWHTWLIMAGVVTARPAQVPNGFARSPRVTRLRGLPSSGIRSARHGG